MQTKKCTRCKETKPRSDFRKCARLKDGLHPWCRLCASTYEKEKWKSAGKILKDRRYSQNKRRSERNIKFYFDFMKDKQCKECGIDDLRVLEFHHIDPQTKKYNVGDAIRFGCSIQTILEEIAKCEILCANCHRIETYKQQGWTYEWSESVELNHACVLPRDTDDPASSTL